MQDRTTLAVDTRVTSMVTAASVFSGNLNKHTDPSEHSKLHSEQPMSSDALRRSSQSYDQQVLAKIGGASRQQTGPGASDQPIVDMHNTLSRLNGQLLNFGKSSFSMVILILESH